MGSDGSSPYQHSPASDELALVPRYSWPVRIALWLSAAVVFVTVLVIGGVLVFGWTLSKDMQQMESERRIVRQILESQPEKFADLTIADWTPRNVGLYGTVKNEEDFAELKAKLTVAFGDEAEVDRASSVAYPR